MRSSKVAGKCAGRFATLTLLETSSGVPFGKCRTLSWSVTGLFGFFLNHLMMLNLASLTVGFTLMGEVVDNEGLKRGRGMICTLERKLKDQG